MSQFAYCRVLANNILTTEKMQQQDGRIRLTEEGLCMKDMQCDSKISNHSLEQLIEILEVKMKYEKNKQMIIKQSSSDTEALLLMKGSNTFDRDVCVYIYNGYNNTLDFNSGYSYLVFRNFIVCF